MKTKRIITEQDSIDFFTSSICTMDDAFGVIRFNTEKHEVSFDFNSVLLLRFNGIYAETNYNYNDAKFDESFISLLHRCFFEPIHSNTEYEYKRVSDGITYSFSIKLELQGKTPKATIICYEKLLETEKHMALFSNVVGAGMSMFSGVTWWIDYDKYNDHFYQTDNGPKLLGIKVNPDKLYNTREFQKVRDNARIVSPFYDESIEEEAASYDQVRNNKSDYFGGRTPAVTANDEIIWVESYGKCYLRYPDGSPRFTVAIDIYLSEIFENLNQLNILNNLIDTGMISSDVGVWYHQRHFKEGRYYFTESYQELMADTKLYKNVSFTDLLNEQISICEQKGNGYDQLLHNFRKVHNSIYTTNTDKYHLTIPNYKGENELQWIDVRGTVIERDEEGNVMLFVGVNVDVTESYNRRRELEQLRIQNERLQLAERLAVKARGLLVWYLEPNETFDMNYIFANEMFTEKLGVSRSKEGSVYFNDLLKTLDMSTKESKALNLKLLRELKDVVDEKKDTIKKVLGKHKHLTTGETIYLEHSVEITEASFNSEVRMIGGILLDVTESILNQEKIKYLANHDVLTTIYNRNYFEEFIKNLLPHSYTVILLDVDGLKLTNDAFGHIEGDKSIKFVASQLKHQFSTDLFVGRIGGDEFVVITNKTEDDSITKAFEEFELALEQYNYRHPIEINVSKGAISVINNEIAFDKAFVQAENIMYRRKLNNRSSRKSKVLESILETLNAKTEETIEHSERLSRFAVKTMKGLGLTRASEVDDVKLLAIVHDIGKITIPDEVLFKKTRLNKEEYEVIKKHCEAGYKIIKNITDSDDVCNGVLFHHERWDGKGYPQGLKGNEIPIFARIICVADSYDAMTSQRVYQKKKNKQEAIKELIDCAGKQFDPSVVKAFLKKVHNIEWEYTPQ